MKKLTVVVALGGSLFLFLLATKAGYPPLLRSLPRHATSIVILSSSGERLPSLFEGLPRNPLYSLDRIQPRTPPCAKANSLSRLPIFRLLASTPVHACGTCEITGDCTGRYWQDVTLYCNTGGGCSGSYSYTVPYGSEGDLGTTRTGGSCDGCSECGCAEFTCFNGGPR